MGWFAPSCNEKSNKTEATKMYMVLRCHPHGGKTVRPFKEKNCGADMLESLASFHVKAPKKFHRIPINMHTLLTTYRTKYMPSGRKLFLLPASIKH